ncbi:hypothetical protein SeMB42_g07196 [Synchytrium endobioticum]|uniref:F-box domain-containing protein n=1 Tax=Synchytrium endobioticum TaxID=286115 RepID=A0A507CCV0_9FUNG|nr:hypothetical protein SeMB42_g07196 [Synchytrium endobioticum]TPX45022.1 hypothetical protein SeLEV6574_g04142 [Synchytrium endobioticum]
MSLVQPLDIVLIRERVFSLLPNATLSRIKCCSRSFYHHVKSYHSLRQATKLLIKLVINIKMPHLFESLTELKCIDHIFLPDGRPFLVFEPAAIQTSKLTMIPTHDHDGPLQFKVSRLEYTSNRGVSGAVDLSQTKLADLHLGGPGEKETWLYAHGFKLEVVCLGGVRTKLVGFSICRAFVECAFVYPMYTVDVATHVDNDALIGSSSSSSSSSSSDSGSSSSSDGGGGGGCSIRSTSSGTCYDSMRESPIDTVSQHLSAALNCSDLIFPIIRYSRLRITSRRIRDESPSPTVTNSNRRRLERYRYVPISRADQQNFVAMCWDYMLAIATETDVDGAAADVARSLLDHHTNAIRKMDTSVIKAFTTQRKAEELLAGMKLTHSKREATESRMMTRVAREFLSRPLSRTYLRCSGYKGDMEDHVHVYAYLSDLYAVACFANSFASPHLRAGDVPIVPVEKFQDWFVGGLLHV